jgi:hypothetical protein
LAPAFWRGYEEADAALPVLAGKLKDMKEDLDVRLGAATTLGFIGNASNPPVVDALKGALREDDPRNSELVWMSAVALTELGLPDGEDTVMKLLDRKELSQLKYYDRETDPKNPAFRALGEQEQQRYLINAMEGIRVGMQTNPQVRLSSAILARLKEIAAKDPSQRVQWEAGEVLREIDKGATTQKTP